MARKQTKNAAEVRKALDAMARIRAGSRKGAATTKAMIAYAREHMPQASAKGV